MWVAESVPVRSCVCPWWLLPVVRYNRSWWKQSLYIQVDINYRKEIVSSYTHPPVKCGWCTVNVLESYSLSRWWCCYERTTSRATSKRIHQSYHLLREYCWINLDTFETEKKTQKVNINTNRQMECYLFYSPRPLNGTVKSPRRLFAINLLSVCVN